VNKSGIGTAPIVNASVGLNGGAGRAHLQSTAANPRMASAYQASNGIPEAKNRGSGWDSHRSIATQTESHAAAMSTTARDEPADGASRTGRSIQRRVKTARQPGSRSSVYVGVSFI
jgi:hypothetical protein